MRPNKKPNPFAQNSRLRSEIPVSNEIAVRKTPKKEPRRAQGFEIANEQTENDSLKRDYSYHLFNRSILVKKPSTVIQSLRPQLNQIQRTGTIEIKDPKLKKNLKILKCFQMFIFNLIFV